MSGLDEATIRFILACGVALLGFAFLAAVVYFGSRVFLWRREFYDAEILHLLSKVVNPADANALRRWAESIHKWLEIHLQKRNEFWDIYCQVIISILIVVVLAVLLLSKVISAEAGLPILSAVSGFAIAKTATSKSTSSAPEVPPPPQQG